MTGLSGRRMPAAPTPHSANMKRREDGQCSHSKDGMSSAPPNPVRDDRSADSRNALRPHDVLCTEELSRRVPRSPRLREENEAYRLLARSLARRPEEMLNALADEALRLCQGGSAGVSLLEDQPDGTTIFRWVALSGACASYAGGSTPRNFSPCGTCLDENRPVLFAHPERCFTYFQQLGLPIVEGLVLPLQTEEQVFGTIWVMSHEPERRFDSEDVRVMSGLADFTAAALRMSTLHEEVKRSMLEVQRSNADLEQFAYLASHDLQEPLRTVRSYVQLLIRRYQGRLGTDADTFIGYIEDGAERMASLIRGLLTYAQFTRAPSSPSRTVDLTQVFETARRNCDALIEETGAEFTIDSLPSVRGDAEQLVHVFQNLIANALRYRSARPPRVVVTAREEAGMAVVYVRDNGIGIAAEHLANIFGMFQRLSRDNGGAGLGLAVCQRIIERHGGRIWVESVPGEGSVFVFTLPTSD